MAKTGGTIALKNVGQSDCETVRLSIFQDFQTVLLLRMLGLLLCPTVNTLRLSLSDFQHWLTYLLSLSGFQNSQAVKLV